MPLNPLPQLIIPRLRRIWKQLRQGCWSGRRELTVEAAPVTPQRLPLADARKQHYVPLHPGELLGRHQDLWSHRWLRIGVPAAEADEQGRRALFYDARGEATAFVDGAPYAGFDVNHSYAPIGDTSHTVYLDVGLWQKNIQAPGKHPDAHGLRFDGAWTAARNQDAWDAYFDLDVLLNLVEHLIALERMQKTGRRKQLPPEMDPVARRLLRQLDEAADLYETQGLVPFAAFVRKLYERWPAASWQPSAAVVGQSHLDVIWRWPERAGRHKAVHTASTMLRLMERYPDFVFQQTSPWFYQVYDAEPELGEQVRAQVRRGRWEATGAMWTEGDVHLACGEALARAVVYAQRYFKELRGSVSRLMWQPDTFGFCACLPQVLKQAGCDYFFTTKLGWNQITPFPWQSFVWRSPDGSQVIAHLGEMMGSAGASALAQLARRYGQLDVHDTVMLALGAGDGGGGCCEADVERINRLRDLAQVPKTRWSTSEAWFDGLNEVRDRLPEYQGELYLEYHRGTYTTQSECKRLYRQAETALQAHEAVRAATGGAPLSVEAWQRVFVAQFHDALPGTSIRDVYEELNPEMAALAEKHLQQAHDDLAAVLGGEGTGATVFNPLPVRRRLAVRLDCERFGFGDAEAVRCGGESTPMPLQRCTDGHAMVSVTLPPLGTVCVTPESGAAPEPFYRWSVSPTFLDNGLLRAEFDDRGRLCTLTGETGKLQLNGAAGFMLHADYPHTYDAWDIDHHTMEMGIPAAEPLDLQVVEQGPVRAVLRGDAPLGERSHITVDYILEYGSEWLRIEADVDWQEDHRLLRYRLPTRYRGAQARYGEPFGSILRPHTPAGEREEAMWEVPGSRWMALGDDAKDDGVAIVTEAKYGFSCRDGDMGLSLLRAPSEPDPVADRGRHRVRFALAMHQIVTEHDHLSTAALADALYAPVLTLPGHGSIESPFRLQNKGSLVPAWVLPAETRDGLILRLHEPMGARGAAAIELNDGYSTVQRVDLLERPGEPLPPMGENRFRLAYEPYEVISLLIR